MTREPDRTDFDDIVASWQAEGGVPQWPDDPEVHGRPDDPSQDPGAAFDAHCIQRAS